MENPALADDLQREYVALADRRSFGLNFERHVPEAVELPGRKVRKGDKVRVLPPRGSSRTAENDRLWRVTSTSSVDGVRRSALVSVDEAEDETSAAADDLVVVAEFRDPIYPGLVSTGKVERGGDKPFHTVINAENFHALQTLLFTHRGKVDCIYIDPPYNTGARDWTYNNDYVDSNDVYIHSKWLAFMERRLELAALLLAPNGVMVVTIDEHEVQNLGILLRQTLPDARVQLVTIVMNTAGSMSPGLLTRSDEYAYFCFFGDASPNRMPTDLLSDSKGAPQYWFPLSRGRGLNDRPSKRPNLVYPIAVDPRTQQIVATGRSLKDRVDAGEIVGDLDSWVPDPDETYDGLPLVWPMRDSGDLTTWQVSALALPGLISNGYVRVRLPRADPKPFRPFTLAYVKSGTQRRVEAGEIEVTGREPDGALVLAGGEKSSIPKTTWKVSTHDARLYGTTMLRSLLGATPFTYPKSPYAVRDCLQALVADKPRAVILDFFAGSGTTLQATAMLNAQDEGLRQCILVTNNEVAEDQRKTLVGERVRPGDVDWESRGVATSVTWPRVVAAISGVRPDGTPAEGEYVDGTAVEDGFEENAEFLTLTYEAPLRVASNREFAKIAPLLWLRAGAYGRRIDDVTRGWDVAPAYGVIVDLDQSETFLKVIADIESVALAFIVTDEDWLYEQLVAALPDHVEPVRLYEAYLRNFEIEAGRGIR